MRIPQADGSELRLSMPVPYPTGPDGQRARGLGVGGALWVVLWQRGSLPVTVSRFAAGKDTPLWRATATLKR